MKKAILNTVVGAVGGATLLTSAITFNVTPVKEISENISTLKYKVMAYATNEKKIINKYNELYNEYKKLKSASDTNDYSNIDTSSNELLEKDSKINDLEKQLESLISELNKKDNQINELEDKINDLESNSIKNEDTNSSIEVE